MSYLWETDAVLAATNGRPVGDMPEGITGISIDSRTLKKGEAFFAIKGDQFDGHDFLPAALRAGAAFAVVDENRLVSMGGINLPLIVVRDVLEAMTHLGLAARARSKAQIIAVTGSVGKTSVKEMLRTVLSYSGEVHASVASFNNHWGVPLTLARMPSTTNYGIFEIGMNHPDEIRPLVKMVRPHVAMINNVAAAHLGAFDSIDDIARAKAEIFEGVVPGGYAVINHDDKRYTLQRDLAHEAEIEHLVTFGTKRGSDIWLRNLVQEDGGLKLDVRIKGEDYQYAMSMTGEHMAMNSLAVLAAASLAGADIRKTAEAMARVTPTDGRGTRYTIGGSGSMGITLIDESYNANPASMEAALNVLGSFESAKTKRRIAVLGDMLELGKQSKKLHEGLAKFIADAKVDLVFLVGPEMENLAKILPNERLGGHYPDAINLAERLKVVFKGGDVVVFKASNSMGFSKIVQEILE